MSVISLMIDSCQTWWTMILNMVLFYKRMPLSGNRLNVSLTKCRAMAPVACCKILLTTNDPMWCKSHQLMLMEPWHTFMETWSQEAFSLFCLSTGTFCLLACGCQHKADVSKVVPRYRRGWWKLMEVVTSPAKWTTQWRHWYSPFVQRASRWTDSNQGECWIFTPLAWPWGALGSYSTLNFSANTTFTHIL